MSKAGEWSRRKRRRVQGCLLVLLMTIAATLVGVSPAVANGWSGSITLSADNTTLSDGSTGTTLRYNVSGDPLYSPYQISIYNQDGGREYCAPADYRPPYNAYIALNSSMTYTAYIAQDCPTTGLPAVDVVATSNVVTVTNTGWHGSISMSADSTTVTAGNSGTTLRYDVSSGLSSPYQISIYNQYGNREYCTSASYRPPYNVSVSLNSSMTYTAYIAQDCPMTGLPTNDIRAVSDSVTVTNVGWHGGISLSANRTTVDASNSGATLTYSIDPNLANPYQVSIYNQYGQREYCASSAYQPPANVGVPIKLTNTYTAYIAQDCPTSSRPTNDVRAISNTVAITNVGWSGGIAVTADTSAMTPSNPTATVHVTATSSIPSPYEVTLYNGTQRVQAWYNCPCSTTVSGGGSYTAYVAIDSPDPGPPQTAVASAGVSIASSGDTDQSVSGFSIANTIAGIVDTGISINEICDALTDIPGTHFQGTSTSDQLNSCLAAAAAGMTVQAFLTELSDNGSIDALSKALNSSTQKQETDPANPSPAPPSNAQPPTTLPPAWSGPIAELTDVLQSRNPGLTAAEAGAVAKTCIWDVSAAGGNPLLNCESLPIFASGQSDVAAATNHDIAALNAHPQWVFLNYEAGSSKPNRQWYRNMPDCATASSTASPPLDCDEYPFFSTEQGGSKAKVTPDLRVIDAAQNRKQGRLYGGAVAEDGAPSFRVLCGLTTGTPPADRTQANSTGGTPFLGIPLPPEFASMPTLRICNS
jgi:hypothetical protein